MALQIQFKQKSPLKPFKIQHIYTQIQYLSMKAKILVFVAFFLALGTALHLQQEQQNVHYPLGFITIQASNGKYLGLCNSCGIRGVNPDSAVVASDDANDINNHWYLIMDENRNLYLQARNTQMLGAYMDRSSRVYYYLFASAKFRQQTRSKWELIPLEKEGEWALKNKYARRYLERVDENFSEPNFGQAIATNPELVFVTSKQINAQSTWTIKSVL